jgi:hypothetical protein
MDELGVEKYLDDINLVFFNTRRPNCQNGGSTTFKMYEF